MFYIYGIILTIWNYVTPVFYSVEILPANLQALFQYNPMYQYITAVRQIVLFGQGPSFMTMGILLLISIVTFMIGAITFRKKQDKFIYYV